MSFVMLVRRVVRSSPCQLILLLMCILKFIRVFALGCSIAGIAAGGELTGAIDDAGPAAIDVGVSKADITPLKPILLAGYLRRTEPSDQVAMPLQARALAIGAGADAVVILTADLCGITAEISDTVAAALRASHNLRRAQVAVCVTHTHSAPLVRGYLPGQLVHARDPIDQARINAYTDRVIDILINTARRALSDRRPSHLSWGEGRAGFALHRRVIVDGKWTQFGGDPDGSVDHTLPVLAARDEAGNLRAVLTSYACHCTSAGGGAKIHPDWAGCAAAEIEANHPDAVALVVQGCGADANPAARGSTDAATKQGSEIAREVDRLLKSNLSPLGGTTQSAFRRVELPLDRIVERPELVKQAAEAGNPAFRYAAERNLARLDAGEALPTAIPLSIQAWRFGPELTMVFLGGEVVSEYSLRLRREVTGTKLWVNAYANGVPAYIPSRRMYSEGGYEVDGSMNYYDWPVRLDIGTEDRVIAAVHELIESLTL